MPNSLSMFIIFWCFPLLTGGDLEEQWAILNSNLWAPIQGLKTTTKHESLGTSIYSLKPQLKGIMLISAFYSLKETKKDCQSNIC